jgi:hypothetical protein
MKQDRRRLLGMALGGALMASVPAGAQGRGQRSMDALQAHLRMRCYAGEQSTYWYYSGTVFGQPSGEMTRPMLHVEGISQSQLDVLPGGQYRYSLQEAGYFGDPVTGAISDRVMNPFSGEWYQPSNYLSGQTNIMSPDLSVRPDSEALPPGLEYRGEISPLQTFKDMAWSTEDLFVRLPNENPGELVPAFTVQTSLATFVADRRDLFDAGIEDIDCQFYYQTLATWRPWMNMGTRPGVISWRLVGTKCRRDDLPRELTDRIRSDHPEFFTR